MKHIDNLLWFRNDLRLEDNSALSACSNFESSAAIYIYDKKILESSDFSNLHLDFINDSLAEMSQKFRDWDSHLNIFYGDTIQILNEIHMDYGVKNLFSHHEVRNLIVHNLDKNINIWCHEIGVKWHQFQRNGVVKNLKNRDGWSRLWSNEMKKPLISKPNISNFKKLESTTGILSRDQLGIAKIHYTKQFKGGEQAAKSQLQKFLNETGQTYSKDISSPLSASRSCSRLSSYLSYGNLSLRYLVKKTQERQVYLRKVKTRDGWLGSLSAFSSRLRWHCHFIQKLEMQPSLENTNMVRAFDSIRTDTNKDFLLRWQMGETGNPMIDACMRFLKKNGWINFRMRAMLVSFASYNLWLDWRTTSKFLSKYFIDYEPGIHYNQFQMQSGVTGINAIRIYNPIKQQADHDPSGEFVRKWVPELVNVPKDYLQYPQLMSEFLQKKVGCIIGKSYPEPVVDLKISSLIARKNIFSIKALSTTKKQSNIAYQVHGSRRKIRKKI